MSNYDRLLTIIKDKFPFVDTSRIEASIPLEHQGMDSLDMTTLLFAVEKAFGILIPTAKVSTVRSLEDIAQILDASEEAA